MTYSKRIFKDKEYYWPINDNTGWMAISNTWFQVEWALKNFNARGICVQAGGNNGLYPVLLSKHFEHVHTFEPGPVMFDCLTKNIELHNCNNITAYYGALSDTKENLVLNVPSEDNLGASHMLSRNIHQYPINKIDNIPSYRIDDLNLEDCSFLLLDIEGYEQFALLGALETIKKYKPVIMLELNDACTAYGFTNEEVSDWVEKQGYRISSFWRHDRLFLPE